MIKILCAALFLLPLLGTIQMGPVLSVPLLSSAKEFMALFAIMLMMFFSWGGRRERSPVDNIISGLMLFLVVSTFSIPPINLQYGHENLGGLWAWRGLAWCFAYYLLYRQLSGAQISPADKANISRCIAWAAVVSAGYAYIQALELDQWQFTRNYHEIGDPAAPEISGMMGHASNLGIWLVMALPFVFHVLKKRWALFIADAVILSKSDVALAGLVLIVVLWACLRLRSAIWIKIGIGLGIAGIIALAVFWGEIRPRIHDNGRFGVWGQTFDDWRGPCVKMAIRPDMSDAQVREIEYLNQRIYALTGRGLGSFPFIFGPKFGTPFESAHNEWLESLYSIGLIGVALLGVILFLTLKSGIVEARQDNFTRALCASLIFALIAAFFHPVLHSEPMRFYVAVLVILTAIGPARSNS